MSSSAAELTFPELARQYRERVKDKSYRAFPLGQEAGRYLRAKRKRLTPASYRDYESSLDKLARFFPDLELRDLEPPIGTERIEEHLEHHWGGAAPRTYNKHLSIVSDFFRFQRLRGSMHGDPTLAIERARKRDVHRETFNADTIRAIIAEGPEPSMLLRDRLALRLLLDYGIRKGALRAIRFQHFDHYRKRLTIFTKGGKVRNIPLPQTAFWFDLERLLVESEARPSHYLMQRQLTRPVRFDPETHKAVEFAVQRFADEPMGVHGLHLWWYGCLERAGIVASGTTSGERMHKARHTAGQRVLDKTGNLKAVQKFLGHASIQTTGDTYTDWDEQQLAETMLQVLEDE